MQFDIRSLGVETIDEQINLLSVAFNESDESKPTYSSMYHKYYENPLQLGAVAFGAYDGDRLVGMNAYMPAKYLYKGKEFISVQSCDGAVFPEYQRKGIFSQLTEKSAEYFKSKGADFLLACPMKTSYPSFKKCKFITKCYGKYAHILLNPSIVLASFHKKELPCILDGIYSVPFSVVKLKEKLADKMTVSVTKTPEDNVFFDNYLSEQCISADCSTDFINWKLKGDLFLYCVIRDSTNQPVAKFIIKNVDFVAVVISHTFYSESAKSQQAAIALLLIEMRKKKFGVLSFWTALDTPVMREFKKSGGILYDHYKPGIPYMIRILTEDPEKIQLLDNCSLWSPQRLELDTTIDNFDTSVYTRKFF